MDKLKVVENIQRICKEKGTNPTVAGEKSGAGKEMVSNMKQKGTIPSIERFQLLAQYLGVSTSELLGEEKPTPEDGDGLAERAIRLDAWFHSLPPETRKAILTLGGGPEDLAE